MQQQIMNEICDSAAAAAPAGVISPTMETNTTKVRFSDNANLEFTGTALDHVEADKNDIWYHQGDMKQIKEAAFLLARQAGRYGVGSLLSNTYGNDDLAAMSAIQAWVNACAERRGLERFHCRHYAKRRLDIRRKTILSVLKAQHRMLVEEKLTDRVYVSVVIGRLSEAYSMEARRFARVLGQADAVTAAVLHHESSVQDNSSTTNNNNNHVNSRFLRLMDTKPSQVQRQKTPQSITMFDQWTEQESCVHLSSVPVTATGSYTSGAATFSKAVSNSPSSVMASNFLNCV
jgi:hypothetical protein